MKPERQMKTRPKGAWQAAFKRNSGPVIHVLRTLPDMAVELIRTPMHLLRQESDWKALTGRLSGIAGYPKAAPGLRTLLQEPYHDYISTVSSPLISLSLNRATFFYYLVRLLDARNILDMGSGFSSYVFRHATSGINNASITSVDDSKEWLSTTETFLRKHHQPTTGMITLETYHTQSRDLHPFDLCLVDIGDIALRKKLLPVLVEQVALHGGVLVFDDFHVASYRKYIIDTCRSAHLQLFSVRKFTRRRLSHAALAMRADGTRRG